MRPPLALAAALVLAAGAASAQTDAADLVGQTVYATGGSTFRDRTTSDGADADGTGMTEASSDWAAIGRVAGVGTLDGAPVALLDLEGIETDVPVMLDQLQIVADADDPGTLFVLSQTDARTLESRAVELERDRLAESAAADNTVFEQDSAVADGEILEESPAVAADPAPTGAESDTDAVVVTDQGSETAAVGDQASPEVETAQAGEALREEEIADPNLPPIEDAENVVPEPDPGEAEVPGLEAETEFRPPTQSAATPLEPGEADVEAVRRPTVAPEDFAPVDMSTLDPKELLQVRVYTLDDENIGQIDRWIGEGQGRRPEAAVVDVGGFLGLGSREIAIGTEMMTLLADADGNDLRVYVDLTEEQIEGLPEVAE